MIFFCCHRIKSEEGQLPEPVFRAVLVDAFMAEAYIQDESQKKGFNPGALMNHQIYPLIWKKYAVDSTQFVRTFDYYIHHPDDFRTVLNKVMDTLNLIAKTAPIAPNAPVIEPDVTVPIESDTALANDAMRRFYLLHGRKQKQSQQNRAN